MRQIRVIMPVFLLLPFVANATLVEFDLTYDGTSISVDASSPTPAGTSFLAGDSFNVELRANGSDFWRVEAPYDNQFVPMTFFVLDPGNRTADIEALFFLNGIQVANIVELGIGQSSVHIGAQVWSLAVGLEFDTVVLNYVLLATNAPTTIQAVPDIFESFGLEDSPFFRSDDISYNVSVPEPGTLALLAIGLLGMHIGRRRKI